MAVRQRGDWLRGGRDHRRVHGLQEGFALLSREAVLALVGHRLVAVVVGALDRRPLHIPGLAGDGGAFLGGVVLGDGLGPHLVQPHIAEQVVGLPLEAHGEVRRLVRGRADQDAIVVDLVPEDHLLDGQRDVRHLRGEGEFRIRIQHIELNLWQLH